VINDIFSQEDWFPTFLAAAGEPNIKEKLKKGHKAVGKTFKVRLDGYDQTALLTGRGKGARNEIFYFDSGGNLNAVRYQDWKIHFCLMEGDITQAYRKTPSWPVVVNVRQDPFERFAFESRMYLRWMADKLWCFLPAQAVVGQFLATFQEFPPSQKSDSLSVDQVLAKLSDQQSRN
jgi:arylsulfatase